MPDSSPQTQTSTSPSVLFVCLGNICRSPMAEGVFRSLAAAKRHCEVGRVDSAGTGAYHVSDPPDARTMHTLRSHGITEYEHGARRVCAEDFAVFDYVFAMDRSNLRDLQRLQRRVDAAASGGGGGGGGGGGQKSKSKARVMLFGEYSGRGKAEEVEDPYYGADDGFERVYEQVDRLSRNFLAAREEVVQRTEQNGLIATSQTLG